MENKSKSKKEGIEKRSNGRKKEEGKRGSEREKKRENRRRRKRVKGGKVTGTIQKWFFL